MITTVITSILAFVATNVDDLFILMLYYGNRNAKSSDVTVGQYLGIATLVGLSFVGAYVGSFVDQRYVGLLGLFPIYLAIRHTINLLKNRGNSDEVADLNSASIGFLSIAGVTIANGGDNIGVYVPLLTTMSVFEKVQMLVVFAIMTYLWCLSAKFLARRPLVARQLDRYGHIIMPLVLFCLGVFILIESSTPSLLFAAD